MRRETIDTRREETRTEERRGEVREERSGAQRRGDKRNMAGERRKRSEYREEHNIIDAVRLTVLAEC